MDIPAEPPRGFFDEFARPRRDVWQRIAVAVIEMAESGHSTRLELKDLLARRLDLEPGNSSLDDLLGRYLPHYELAESEVHHSVGKGRELGIIRLTDKGKRLAVSLGVHPVESDWERLIRLHQAETQKAHAVLVLRFVALVRLWGGRAWVMPEVDADHFAPDVLIQYDSPPPYSTWAYVEVEGEYHKHRKWSNQARYQGFTAFCAKTPTSRHALKWECHAADAPGMGTDLETLIQLNRRGETKPLWQENWSHMGYTACAKAAVSKRKPLFE